MGKLVYASEEAWATWKRTGLAVKAQPIPENGVAFLEAITVAGTKMLIPRRAALGAPNTENLKNYNAAINELIADPNYGSGS